MLGRFEPKISSSKFDSDVIADGINDKCFWEFIVVAKRCVTYFNLRVDAVLAIIPIMNIEPRSESLICETAARLIGTNRLLMKCEICTVSHQAILATNGYTDLAEVNTWCAATVWLAGGRVWWPYGCSCEYHECKK
jgi:hypothetical protein